MFEALQFEFMRNAIAAGLLAALACGVVGVYITVKKIVFVSDGIAHFSFGGVGLGYLLGINPIWSAMAFTIASAVGMGFIIRRTKLPEDTVIGVLLAMGMALGIIFIGMAPGYAPDLFSYLFGNILTVPMSDLILIAALDAIILITIAALYKEFLILCFDEEFGSIAGMPTEKLYFLLLCIIALTVVVMIRVVGIILVIALLTIPATLARKATHDVKTMMILATVYGAAFTFGGLWLSYVLDLASGATIILLSGTVLLASFGFSKLRRKKQ
jgi:zinc transport system permease protein